MAIAIASRRRISAGPELTSHMRKLPVLGNLLFLLLQATPFRGWLLTVSKAIGKLSPCLDDQWRELIPDAVGGDSIAGSGNRQRADD